jgi:adenine deaminase
MDDDDIEVPLRLDDDTIVKLAKVAHEARLTLNDAVLSILAWYLSERSRTPRSRNQREGRYVGTARAGHLRSNSAFMYYGKPDSSVAWLLATQRNGKPLKAHRPGYTAKALRAMTASTRQTEHETVTLHG